MFAKCKACGKESLYKSQDGWLVCEWVDCEYPRRRIDDTDMENRLRKWEQCHSINSSV